MKRRWIGSRIDAWVLRRVKRQQVAVVPRTRVYILPTRFGYGFALMTLVMLLGATNYSNSMAFALSFLLGALGLVCMHHTHANLVNVQLRGAHVDPVYAGETLQFELLIANPSKRIRHDLQIGWPRLKPSSSGDVGAGSQTSLKLAAATSRRGWHDCGVFSLSTEFPLGLFRAWTWIELDLFGLVYPLPIDAGARPERSGGVGGEASGGGDGQEDFAGLRAYRAGDSLRLVHWKSLSKAQPPMVKQFTDTASPELWLDWQALPQLDTEARLSQLARWVLDAQAAHGVFGLRLPGAEIAPSSGEEHMHACLSALALFGSRSTPPRQ
ncbi:MAG: hypothetical protein JWQ90_3903 [Hydrocarboniphaga sp.]|uniref:DUF58 domain-containing protein n=1 Tax=Hydrocarboniphaga sp. TaxID=2033016 RepID=UPI0026168C9B|nr:DUF58 domain-containing protein [Hydrocarboniphaga sp.]MDB5971453.1 hypothetical protein [Hydrocarboniphaga sp.]